MKQLRASAGQRASMCPASCVTSEDKPEIRSFYSERGTAFGQLKEIQANEGREPTIKEVEQIALERNLEPSQLQDVFDLSDFDPKGYEAEVPVVFEVALPVEDVEGFEVKGTLDAARHTFAPLPQDCPEAIDGPVHWGEVLDYKLTQRPQDHTKAVSSLQLATYTLDYMKKHQLLCCRMTYHFPLGEGTEASPRYDWAWITPSNIDVYHTMVNGVWSRARAQYELEPNERTYHPNLYGPQTTCGYCAGRSKCPAIYHKAASDMNSLGMRFEEEDLLLRDEDAVRRRWKQLELASLYAKSAKSLREEVRNYVLDHGPVKLLTPDGYATGRSINVTAAKSGTQSVRVLNDKEADK